MAFIISKVRLDNHNSPFQPPELWIYYTILGNPSPGSHELHVVLVKVSGEYCLLKSVHSLYK